MGYRNWNEEVMRDIIADVEPSWDDLMSDIRAHEMEFKQCILTCWEDAIATLGLSLFKTLTTCSVH